MRFFDRLRRRLPQVPITPQTEEILAQRVQAMCALSDVTVTVVMLRELVEMDLFACCSEFRDKLGVPDEELAVELYLQLAVGLVLGAHEAGYPEGGAQAWPPLAAELREYVGYGHRERFDAGPLPLLIAAEKLDTDKPPEHLVLGMLPMRLGVAYRPGASQGLIRLASLCQQAGRALGGSMGGDTRGDMPEEMGGDMRGDMGGDRRGDMGGDTRGDIGGDTRGDTDKQRGAP